VRLGPSFVKVVWRIPLSMFSKNVAAKIQFKIHLYSVKLLNKIVKENTKFLVLVYVVIFGEYNEEIG